MLGVIAASVLMHVVLWPLSDQVLDWAASGGSLPRSESIMEISLLDRDEPQAPAERPLEEPPPEDPPGKLVQLDKVTDERSPERDTPYVSEFDNRTARPTRAPNSRPQPGAIATPRGNDGRDGKADGETPNPESNPESKALPLLPNTNPSERGADDRDPVDPDARGELSTARGGPPLPSPSGSPGTRKALLDALGSPGSHDDIGDDAELDDATSVDSKRWKFASFFNRVRNAIAQRWHPEVVHAANDPDGSRFGTQTRKTRLIIALNPDGSLSRVRLDGSSGVDHLDQEAIHAVRTAAPFANPPAGLVDRRTGLIEFSFGFIFEFGGGARIFRYQR